MSPLILDRPNQIIYLAAIGALFGILLLGQNVGADQLPPINDPAFKMTCENMYSARDADIE
jgi:hypothetical protein